MSSCVELLDEFAGKANQPCYDPWNSVDSHDKSKTYAHLTPAYKKTRLASKVEASVAISLSPDNPNILAP